MPPDARRGRLDVPAHGDRDALGQLEHGEVGAQVVRDRVEAAGVHEPGAALLRPVVVAGVHRVDELRLAGEVQVVGAGGRAGGDQPLAVGDVRADGRRQHPGLLGERAQRGGIGRVGFEQGQLAQGFVGRGESRADLLELVAAATGQRPAALLRRVRGEVARGQFAGEPGRPEQDDVVGAISHG